MVFESFAEFVSMGHHGPYVWSAYGISLAVIIGNIAAPVIRGKKIRGQIRRKIRREEGQH